MMVVAALASGMHAISAAAADNTTGSGATLAISETQFAGTARLNICGQEKSADLLVTVVEPPIVDANGVHHVKAMHEFTFADGSSITTSDQEVATPIATPGLYTLTAEMQVVLGTGIFEGVSGHLVATGTINFASAPPEAEFDLSGTVTTNTTGSGVTAAINDHQFRGTATLAIDGREKSADLLVTVVEPPVVDGNGVHHVKAMHEFTFVDGSTLTTSDQEVATPTATPGLYALTATMDIVSGTGICEGVTGRLEANGTINFSSEPPAAEFDLAGAVIQNTTGSGATIAINDHQFAGNATLFIQGQEKSSDLLVTVLEPPIVDANGVQYVKATHEFTFGDGSTIMTSDYEIATPAATPGMYTIAATLDIVSGTGIYDGAIGRLEAIGTIDFAAEPPAAHFDIAGGVSFCGDVNHPYPVGDLNEDCYVNLLDMAMVASHWMNCTHPNRD